MKELSEPLTEETERIEPNLSNIMAAILLTRGQYSTYRVHRIHAKKTYRNISTEEYKLAVAQLVATAGMTSYSLKFKGVSTNYMLLVKNRNYDALEENVKRLLDKETYLARYGMDSPREITPNILAALAKKMTSA